MSIFEAIYGFIQAAREAVIGILEPLIMPDWGWLITVILPLALFGLVLLWLAYLAVRYQRSARANADRRPSRLGVRANPPPGVHMPGPSWWPIALSLGSFLVLLGLVVDTTILAVGVVVTLAGGWGWLRSANREWRRAESGAAHGEEHGAGARALASGEAAAGALAAPSRALVPHGATAVATVPAGAAGAGEAEVREAPPGVHMPAPSWWPVYASLAAFFVLLGLVVDLALLTGGLVLSVLAFIGWYVDAYRELKVAEGLAPRPHVRDPLAVFPRILATLGAITVVAAVSFAALPGLIPAAGPTPGPGGSEACVPPTTIEITAVNVLFDRDELCLPADVPFRIVFHNEDAGIQHNVAIATFFSGDVFPGVETRTYDVPPIPAGRWQFVCVVHPITMVGTAIVVPVDGGPPDGASPPAGGPSPGTP